MSHSTPPSLNADYLLSSCQHPQLHRILDAPLQTVIHVNLPVGVVEVGLGLGEEEGVHAAVEMRVPRCRRVACHHDNGAARTELGDDASRAATVEIG